MMLLEKRNGRGDMAEGQFNETKSDGDGMYIGKLEHIDKDRKASMNNFGEGTMVVESERKQRASDVEFDVQSKRRKLGKEEVEDAKVEKVQSNFRRAEQRKHEDEVDN